MKTIFKKVYAWLHLSVALLLANRLTSMMIILCIATSYFAMQMILGPSAAMTAEISVSPMTDSYSLDFSSSGITQESAALLFALFSEEASVKGHSIHSGFYGSFSDNQPAILGVKNCGNNTWYIQAEGRYFSDAEVDGGAKVAIISHYNYDWNDFNLEQHAIHINNADYQLVGLGSFRSASQFFAGKQEVFQRVSPVNDIQERLMRAGSEHQVPSYIEQLQEKLQLISNTILIPYTTFEKNHFDITVVNLMFHSLTDREREGVLHELCDLFPEAIVTAPPPATAFMASALKRDITISIALSCCCLLFLYALYVFWINQNHKPIKSCRIVGASRPTMRIVVCLTWMLMLLLGYGMAFLVAWMSYPVMNMLKISLDLQPKHHIALFLVPVLITMLLSRFGAAGTEERGNMR